MGWRDAYYGRPYRPRRMVRPEPGSDRGAFPEDLEDAADRAAYEAGWAQEDERAIRREWR